MRSRSAELDAFSVERRQPGNLTTASTSSPAHAADVLATWFRDTPDAALIWRVNNGWPERILLLARRPSGPNVPARECTVHLFLFQPGATIGPVLVAECGAEFPWYSLEFGESLTTGFGAPCIVCQISTLRGSEQTPQPTMPTDQAVGGRFDAWTAYYGGLGWPCIETDGRLLLVPRHDGAVAILSVPKDLAESVCSVLAQRKTPTPMLYLPDMPEAALFVSMRSGVEAPLPPGVVSVAAPVPLPPSATVSGTAIEWSVSPRDVAVDRCVDLQVIQALWAVTAAERDSNVVAPRQWREVTSAPRSHESTVAG